MTKIKNVYAREVLDSRGNPTVEVEVTTDNAFFGRAIVPSGASTGSKEALELRDNDPKRYLGKGVLQAVKNVNEVLKDLVIGQEVTDQAKIDQILIEADGTKDKSRYGANAILGISMAVSVAAAASLKKDLADYLGNGLGVTLPVPMMNVLNGGCHANSSVDFQEYMIVPVGASSIKEAIRMGSETFHHLKKILQENNQITAVGDEGGFAPNLKDNEEPLKYIMKAIIAAGYTPGEDIAIALDVAASEFYNKETHKYELTKSDQGSLSSNEMISWLAELVQKYPIISIEDGLDENDWEGWVSLTKKLGSTIQLVGDDIFVTNPEIFKEGIKQGLANAILIKVNQIGTVTEAIEAINIAQKNGYKAVVSHRSGETEDTFIASFAVAFNVGQIKTGSMSRIDRIAKYNELMRIAEKLSDQAIYPGKNIYKER